MVSACATILELSSAQTFSTFSGVKRGHLGRPTQTYGARPAVSPEHERLSAMWFSMPLSR